MNQLFHTLVGYVLMAAVVIGGFWFFKGHVKVKIEAEDASMDAKTFPPGSYTLDTSIQKSNAWKAGDVVAYRAPTDPEKPRVARVMAVEGQRVAMDKDGLKVDGAAVNAYVVPSDARIPEIRVPRGCAFLLVDNPSAGNDSLKLGPIPYHQIVGKLK